MLAQRLGEFAGQDDLHSRLLHGVLLKLADESKDQVAEDAGVSPFTVSGLSRRRGKKEKGEDADLMEVFSNFMESLPSMEREFQDTLKTALAEPGLAKRAAAVVDLKGLDRISRDRCLILDGINKLVLRGELFKRPKPASWSCMSCGVTMGLWEQAPEVCPCCQAPQSMIRGGGWGLP